MIELRTLPDDGPARKMEFILAPEYEGLEVIEVESDTMGPEPVFVVTLGRQRNG